jgi:hypothetical protein
VAAVGDEDRRSDDAFGGVAVLEAAEDDGDPDVEEEEDDISSKQPPRMPPGRPRVPRSSEAREPTFIKADLWLKGPPAAMTLAALLLALATAAAREVPPFVRC